MKLKYLSLIPFLLAGASASSYAQNVVADPEPVDYVRVCDAYGKGYFYIPGTETCLRISGYVRTVIMGGDEVYAKRKGDIDRKTYYMPTRGVLRFATASDTELGTLRSYMEIRSQWTNGRDTETGILRYGYIELGGLRVGVDDSIFVSWPGYFGNVYHDDINNQVAYARTNVISYTYNAGNGFSATLGVEQGSREYTDTGIGYRLNNDVLKAYAIDSQIDDYSPNVVGGVKYEQDWGGLFAVVGYESYYKDWAGKVRLNVNATDKMSFWVMGGYKSGDDHYGIDSTYTPKIIDGRLVTGIYRLNERMYGDWGGDWSAWGGGTYKFTPKTSFNFQVNYDDARTFATSVNIIHEIVPGLIINPELNYISWENNYHSPHYRVSMKGEDAFRGMLQIQRSF